MKLILSLTTIPVIWLAGSIAQAQTTAPTPTSPVDFGNSSGQIQSPGGFSNSNNSSDQFFQEGRDKLYFLEESDPVLEIDEEITEETEDREEIEENQLEQIEQRNLNE